MSAATWIQAGSLLGALLILTAYAGQQYAGLRGDGLGYGLLNLVGSALLALSALRPINLGVVILETAWAGISLGIVVRAARRGRSPTPPAGAA
ncbi:MAG TPA: hypothetical protein VF590_28000 [Isosphaeraceae bacterium]|jgi:hypothetical protein